MRLAVITLHHTHSPLSKIDWGSLGCLDKRIAVLLQVSNCVVNEVEEKGDSQKALEELGEPPVLCTDTSGSYRRGY